MNKANTNVNIVAFVGMAGAGKSEAVEYVVKKGYPKVYFGGIVLDEVKRRGLELTQENEKPVREELRRNEGMDFAAKRIAVQIKDLIDAGQHKIIADGLYSWSEYKYLKHTFPGQFHVVAVITPRHIRYHRLTKRPIRPLTHDEAEARDWAEIEGIEKGGPIAIADHYIINDGSLEKLHADTDRELRDLKFYS